MSLTLILVILLITTSVGLLSNVISNWVEPELRKKKNMTILAFVLLSIVGALLISNQSGKAKTDDINNTYSNDTNPAGWWGEKSKTEDFATRKTNVLLYGNKIRFLMITKISATSYTVRYSIDKDEQFDEVFTRDRNTLTGTTKAFLSKTRHIIYIGDNNTLYYGNTFFALLGRAKGD